MKVIRDDLWLCVDCLMCAVNGDLTGIDDDARAKEVEDGVASLGANLVTDFDSDTGEGILEFSRCGCDACGTRLAGTMHRFAVLGEDDDAGDAGIDPEPDARARIASAQIAERWCEVCGGDGPLTMNRGLHRCASCCAP